MLARRLTIGSLLILFLLLLVWLDQWVGAVRLPELRIEPMHLPALLQQLGFPAWFPGRTVVLHLSDMAGRAVLPPGLVILALAVGLLVLASREFSRLLEAKGALVPARWLWLGAVVGCLLVYWSPDYGAIQPQLAWAATWGILIVLVALRRHSLGGRAEGALLVAAATGLVLIYLGLLPGFYLAIRRWHSAWVLAAVVLVTKSCDIGAYFTGRVIGRTQLVPWISPGKTREGLLGGMLAAGLVAVGAVLLGRAVDEPAAATPLGYAAFAGILLGLVGQGGDLMMSLFKRDADVKDTGVGIPGFGGILDVVDSLLLAGPVAYWLLLMGPVGSPPD